MHYRYLVKGEALNSPEIGRYNSFALQCYRCGPFSKELAASVSDVSTDRAFVWALADLYTAGQLHPVHLLDAVLDAI